MVNIFSTEKRVKEMLEGGIISFASTSKERFNHGNGVIFYDNTLMFCKRDREPAEKLDNYLHGMDCFYVEYHDEKPKKLFYRFIYRNDSKFPWTFHRTLVCDKFEDSTGTEVCKGMDRKLLTDWSIEL